jgi:hypothetical protein
MCRYTRMHDIRGESHMSCIQVSCAWRNVWEIEIERFSFLLQQNDALGIQYLLFLLLECAGHCFSFILVAEGVFCAIVPSSRTYLIELRIFLLQSATDWGKLAPAAREIWPAVANFSDCHLTGWVGQGDRSGWLSILHLPAAWIFPESIRENILLVGIQCIFLLQSATDWGKLAPAAREIWPAAAKFSDCQLTGWVGQGYWSAPDLTYADVCWRMLACAGVCWRMCRATASRSDVCWSWRTLTYLSSNVWERSA